MTWSRSTNVPFGPGGVLLTDLALLERVDTVDGKIAVTDPSSTGDGILNTALETIRDEDKPRDARHWVGKLGARKGLREELARRLVERGILREEEHTFLWVFQSPRFPTSDPGPEASLRGRIRAVVLAGVEPDTRTMLLLSLITATDLTDAVFERDERRRAKRRVREMVEGEEFGKAVGGAVSDATTAAVIASTTASIGATTATTASS